MAWFQTSFPTRFHGPQLQPWRRGEGTRSAYMAINLSFVSYYFLFGFSLAHISDVISVILISTAWSDARDDAAVNTMTENAIRRIREAAETLNVAHPFLYVNYASAAQASEVFSSYGEKNVQSLRDIQRAVDPHGVFTSRGLWSGFAKLL